MAEYWDVYNENREFTGKTIKRGEPFQESNVGNPKASGQKGRGAVGVYRRWSFDR